MFDGFEPRERAKRVLAVQLRPNLYFAASDFASRKYDRAALVATLTGRCRAGSLYRRQRRRLAERRVDGRARDAVQARTRGGPQSDRRRGDGHRQRRPDRVGSHARAGAGPGSRARARAAQRREATRQTGAARRSRCRGRASVSRRELLAGLSGDGALRDARPRLLTPSRRARRRYRT